MVWNSILIRRSRILRPVDRGLGDPDRARARFTDEVRGERGGCLRRQIPQYGKRGEDPYHTHGVEITVCLIRAAGNHVSQTIFALPGKYGKGILVAPTVHGNLLLGPTAIDIDDKEGTNTTREGLNQVIAKAEMNVKNIPLRQVITSFAGLRAHEDGHEFLIGEAGGCKRLSSTVQVSSHRDLPAAPAIGEMIAQILKGKNEPRKKREDFIATRKGDS